MDNCLFGLARLYVSNSLSHNSSRDRERAGEPIHIFPLERKSLANSQSEGHGDQGNGADNTLQLT